MPANTATATIRRNTPNDFLMVDIMVSLYLRCRLRSDP
jgi:hypothetical protein